MSKLLRAFADISIGAKLGLAMAFVAAALAGVTVLDYLETKASSFEDRVTTTRLETDTARSLVAYYEKQAASGALGVENAKKQALGAVAALRYGPNDYFFVMNLDGVVIAHDLSPKLVGANVLERTDTPGGKRLFSEMRDVAAANGSGDVYYVWPRASGSEPVQKVAHVQLFKPWGWVIATGLYLDDVEAATTKRGLTGALWSLAFALPALALLGFISRSVTRPIGEIITAMRALAAGDLSTDVPAKDRRDEIGSIAGALQVFRDAMIAKRDLDKAAALDADAKVRRAQRLDEITTRFEGNIASLTQGVSAAAAEMEATAQSLLTTADRANERASSVAAAAGQTLVNVETVAAATEEMSATVQEISGQVATSSRMADKAASEARRTGDLVRALSEGADKIGAVAGMIATIADQTNLLALNATIEAARAGEAGRGFAVVAAEVKALAEQTGRATAEIEERVAAVQASTREAVSAIGEISRTVTDMSGVAASVAAAVEEQDAATREIVRNVSQAARGTQDVTTSISEVSVGAGETSAASTQVLGAAKELARYSHDLGREVETFLSGVKAA